MAWSDLKQYVIGKATAKKLIVVLEWTKPLWQDNYDSLYLEEFLTELKCQVD